MKVFNYLNFKIAIITITAIEFLLGGGSPYTSTHKK